MIRHFVRFVVVTSLVTLVSFVLLMSAVNKASQQYLKPRAIADVSEVATRVGREIRGLDLEAARARIDEFRDRSAFALRLIEPEELDEVFDDGAADLVLPLEGRPEFLALRRDDAAMAHFERVEGRSFLSAALLALVVIAFSGYWFGRPLARGLKSQERTIARIADGDFGARVVDDASALGRLGQRLNEMAARIQELVASHRMVLQTVSHEMRTPIARLQFGLELLREAASEDEKTRRIDTMVKDVEDLDRLLEELLGFSRLEAGIEPMRREEVAITELVEAAGVHAGFEDDAAIELRVSGEEVVASLDAAAIERALGNLLRNARRFAKTVVSVTTKRNRGFLFVTIDDDGPGIPAADRRRVLDPFVRLRNEVGPDNGGRKGVGLGLAITRRIVERHGGRLCIEASDLGGASLIVILPLRVSAS